MTEIFINRQLEINHRGPHINYLIKNEDDVWYILLNKTKKGQAYMRGFFCVGPCVRLGVWFFLYNLLVFVFVFVF